MTNRTSSPSDSRTKWKRQTLVGFEIMEAGNFAAFQRLYSAAGVPAAHPSAGPYWPYPGAAAVAHHAQNDLLYRQAAAVTLQKPMPYRLYPSPVMLPAGPSSHPLSGLVSSTTLGGLNSLNSGYYSRDSPTSEAHEQQQQQQHQHQQQQRPGGLELMQRERSKSMERGSPSGRENSDTPTSLKADSDDESIHDV